MAPFGGKGASAPLCQSSIGHGFVGSRRKQWHPTPVLLPGKPHGWRSLVGCSPWGRWGSDTTERLYFHFHFHALEKEMAPHSSALAWRIPGTGEPGGLPSMGSHRVRHDWSDLAVAVVGSSDQQGSFQLSGAGSGGTVAANGANSGEWVHQLGRGNLSGTSIAWTSFRF